MAVAELRSAACGPGWTTRTWGAREGAPWPPPPGGHLSTVEKHDTEEPPCPHHLPLFNQGQMDDHLATDPITRA